STTYHTKRSANPKSRATKKLEEELTAFVHPREGLFYLWSHTYDRHATIHALHPCRFSGLKSAFCAICVSRAFPRAANRRHRPGQRRAKSLTSEKLDAEPVGNFKSASRKILQSL